MTNYSFAHDRSDLPAYLAIIGALAAPVVAALVLLIGGAA